MFKRTIVLDVVQGIIIGRVLVCSDSGLSTAYDLSKQIQLTPLNQKE